MEIKLIELRDKMTFIPIIAIKLSGADGWLARRAGYGGDCILMGRLEGSSFRYDPYEWNDRTFKTAHCALIAKWEEIPNGGMIDVEYELGEKTSLCGSERNISEILQPEIDDLFSE